jgi:acyl dehydratase
VDEVRWLSPLRPGDELTLDVDVVEARASKSRPELGIIKFKCTARNARGNALCEMTSPILIKRRDRA